MYQEVKKKLNVSKFFDLKSIIVYVLSIFAGVAILPSGATPFGLALLGAIADTGFPLIIPFSLIGITTCVAYGWTYLLKYVISALIYILMKSFIKGNTKVGNAVRILLSVAISETIVLLMSDVLIYDAVMAVFMSTTTAIFYIIFSEGLPIILDYSKEKITSYETLMATGILITVMISCLGDFAIFGLSIRNIICILIVLYLGWKKGAVCGVVSGVSVSLVLGIMGLVNASTVATYAVCGLMAGILSRYGKVGAIIGFVIGNAIWVFYINASTEVIIPIGEIIIASVLLFFLPKRVTDFVDNMFDLENLLDGMGPIGLLSDSTIFKLKSVSDVAKDMADNVEQLDSEFKKEETSFFVKNIKQNACQKCEKYKECWDNNYHTLYETIYKTIDALKEKNSVEESDLNLDICDNKKIFAMGMNNTYELYKLDSEWQKKLQEHNKLVAKQLRGVSKAIDNVKEDMKDNSSLDTTYPLLGTGIKVEFAKCEKTKTGNKISGDNIEYVKLKDGKTFVGISDGMGSGETANENSKKVLGLFERYLNTGLEKSVAVDLINSYMMLGDNSDCYTTLDSIIFDNSSELFEFIKFGACPTYILENGKARLISSKTLPIGATINLNTEVLKEKISRGTIIVMVTDGILEANQQKEKWIKNMLEAITLDNPQKISDLIMQEALDEYNGVPKDDMSVVVLKVS